MIHGKKKTLKIAYRIWRSVYFTYKISYFPIGYAFCLD